MSPCQAGHAWPAHRHGTRKAPVGVLFRAERGHGAVRPTIHVRAVVARVNDDRVVGDTYVVERLEQAPDRVVVLDHAVDVFAVAMLIAPAMLRADADANVWS